MADEITIFDIEKWATDKFAGDEKYLFKVIVQSYESEDKSIATEWLKNVNKIYLDVREKLKEIPYVDLNSLKKRISESYDFDSDKIFPLPVYISASPDDHDTVGVLMDEQGKFIDIFEGNDEASIETVALVNRLVGGKEITVYGSHDRTVIDKIIEHRSLPIDLYVSPSKKHAESYWGENRVLFSCIINTADVNQESDVDWKTIIPAKCKNIRTYN